MMLQTLCIIYAVLSVFLPVPLFIGMLIRIILIAAGSLMLYKGIEYFI